MEIILITGDSGAGKTYLATTLKLAEEMKGKKVFAYDNMERTKEMRDALRQARQISPEPDTLIITALYPPEGIEPKLFTRHIHLSRGLINF